MQRFKLNWPGIEILWNPLNIYLYYDELFKYITIFVIVVINKIVI